MFKKRPDINKLPLVVGVGDFAELIGRSRPAVQGYVREGLPVLKRPAPHAAHRVDVGSAVRWLLERLSNDAEARLAAAHASPAADAARARKLAAEARIAEADADAREGVLVPADQVGERWGRMTIAMRERVLAIPPVCVQRGWLPAKHEAAVAAICDDALRELAERR